MLFLPDPRSRPECLLCFVVLLVSLIAFSGCATDVVPEEVEGETTAVALDVVATTAPLCWVVDQLAGEQATCRVFGVATGEEAGMAGERFHPGLFQPSADQVLALGEADLIVVNGAGLEPWLESASLPTSRLVIASEGVDLLEVEGETHSHGREGEHSHTQVDPHVWQDPVALLVQARNIVSAFDRVGQVPAAAKNYEQLAGTLRALSEETADKTLALRETRVATAAEGLAYFARRAGFEIRGFDLDDPAAVSHHEMEHLEQWLAKDRPKIVLAEPHATSELQAALGGDFVVVAIDSLLAPDLASDGAMDNDPAGYDYVALYKSNVRALVEVLAAP